MGANRVYRCINHPSPLKTARNSRFGVLILVSTAARCETKSDGGRSLGSTLRRAHGRNPPGSRERKNSRLGETRPRERRTGIAELTASFRRAPSSCQLLNCQRAGTAIAEPRSRKCLKASAALNTDVQYQVVSLA